MKGWRKRTPRSDEDVARIDPPIERREARDFHVRAFQQRGGRWHQCKTWLSRQFFFQGFRRSDDRSRVR